MKVCSPQLGLSPKSFLGGEVHDQKLIDRLCKLGVNFEVCLPKDRPFKKNKKLKVEYLGIKHIVPPYLISFYSLRYVLRKKISGFSILRLHNPYFLGPLGWIVKAAYPKTQIVTTIHLKEGKGDFEWVFKKTIHIYSHVFAVSNYLKQWLIKEYNYPERQISVIYNGVDEVLKPQKKDRALLKKYGLKSEIVLFYMGLFNKRKNCLFLLEVFKELIKRYKNISLIFCGTGPMKDSLIKGIKAYKLENLVLILPPVNGLEKTKLFNLSDIFLFPSTNEGFGIVAAESFACGKPVVASDNSSLPEVVDDGVTGYLAKTNNKKDWVGKISKLIENEPLRIKMGHAGSKRARKDFTWDKVANKTLGVYKSLLK